MPKYIFAGVGQTVRFDPKKTESDIQGLGTKKIRTCAVAIIIGTETDRISLTHFHLLSNPAALTREVEWVGKPYEIILIKNTEQLKKTQLEIKEHLAETPNEGDTEKNLIDHLNLLKWKIKSKKDHETGMVCINLKKEISSWVSEEKEILYAPKAELLEAVNHINGLWIDKKYTSVPIEFDGDKFVDDFQFENRAFLILNAINHRIKYLQLDVTEENIIEILNYLDSGFKKLGSKNGLSISTLQNRPEIGNEYAKSIKSVLKSDILKKIKFDDVMLKMLEADTAPSQKLRK